jgi:glycosyltransferase involved in cell wall biosynthesis
VLTQYYAPEVGAPQIRLRSVVRELQRHGIRVEVLTAMPNYPAGRVFPAYRGRWSVREEIDGVPIRRTWIFAGTGKSARVRLANYLSFTFTALFAVLLGPKPDLLFVESQPLSLGVVALFLKWLKGVDYIYNVPDLQIDVAKQMGFLRNGPLLRAAWRLENYVVRHSANVSTVTERFIEHFQDRGLPRERISFLPNGADAMFLKPLKPASELLDRWQLHGKKIFLYVGTHAFYHGLETLIDAATLLRDRKDLVFLLIGEGPERPRLMTMAADRQLPNVLFGESPYEEMDRLYSIAYASVATLRNIDVARGMRLSKVFPSLSCSVPVIYSGTGEAAELLVREQCGEVVPPEQPRLLANAIERMARDPIHRDELGRNGRRLVLAKYSWSTIVDNWLEEIGFKEENWVPFARKAEGRS